MDSTADEEELDSGGGVQGERFESGPEALGIDAVGDDVDPVGGQTGVEEAVTDEARGGPDLVGLIAKGREPGGGDAAELPGLHDGPRGAAGGWSRGGQRWLTCKASSDAVRWTCGARSVWPARVRLADSANPAVSSERPWPRAGGGSGRGRG